MPGDGVLFTMWFVFGAACGVGTSVVVALALSVVMATASRQNAEDRKLVGELKRTANVTK